MAVRRMDMNEHITNVFSRQYKRMESELLGLNIPAGYLSIISKYWRYAEQDLQELSKEKDNELDKDSY
jgi:hypothetical protein